MHWVLKNRVLTGAGRPIKITDSTMRTRNVIPDNFVGITVTTPHFKREDEFKRMQFAVNVLHCRQPKPAKPIIADMVRARLYLSDSCVLCLSMFWTSGPHSRGFDLAFDSKEDAEKHEPPHKLKKWVLPLRRRKLCQPTKTKRKKSPMQSTKNLEKN